MVGWPFDLDDPPAEPPEGCQDPQRWWEAYQILRPHQRDVLGLCETCDRLWPCTERRLAVRGLLNAYGGVAKSVGTTDESRARCRWCERPVERHPLGGWLHVERGAGLILCRYPKPGSAPLCCAEPDR